MENTSDSFMPRPLLFCLKSGRSVCYSVPDNNEFNAGEVARSIDRFLETLDKENRIMFVRRYWYLDSVADIAKRYGISESKVKTTLFRCRNRLREHLNKEGYTV